jgi:hypothetical protein
MSVNLSPLGGAAAQFFDNNGQILSGGKLYSYSAGTTIPLACYTSNLGLTAHTNPIILDSAGRIPGGEIWLSASTAYKFVLETSTGILIGTYDNVQGIDTDTTLRSDLASNLGASLIGTADGLTVQDSILDQGNQSSVGPLMKVDWQKQGVTNYPIENEGGIWTADTYAFFGVSAEMTASTVPAPGDGTLTGGPLAAHFVFANNNASGGDVVGYLASSVARTSDQTVFGANFIARNEAGTTNTKLVGLEVDVQPSIGTTVGPGTAGILANVFSITTTAPVFQAGGVGGGVWGNGFLTSQVAGTHYGIESANTVTSVSFIDTTNGSFSESAIKLGKGASQGIDFGSATFGVTPFIYSGAVANDLIITLGSTNFLNIENSSGTIAFQFDAADKTFRTIPATVATLPPAGDAGRRAFVSDATATTFASIVAGGGANPVPVYDDGANWRIG